MYTRLKKGDAPPKRTRYIKSLFEKTPEWALMKRDLDKGFPGKVDISDAQLEAYGITQPRTVARFIRRYIEDNGIGLEVKRSHKDGQESVWVVKPGKSKASRAA